MYHVPSLETSILLICPFFLNGSLDSKQIPIQTPECFSVEINKPILKFTWKCKGLNIAKETLKKKNTVFPKNGAETIGCPESKNKL